MLGRDMRGYPGAAQTGVLEHGQTGEHKVTVPYASPGSGTPSHGVAGTDWRGSDYDTQRIRGAPLGATAPSLCSRARTPGRGPRGRGCGPRVLRSLASTPSGPPSLLLGSARLVSGLPPGRRGRCRRARGRCRSAGARGAERAQGPRARTADDWGLAGSPARSGVRRRRARGQGARRLGGCCGGGGRSSGQLPALCSSMALPGPPEPPRGAPRKAPSLLEMGALCLDSEIILGFTSHLLRRRAKVSAGRRDPAGGRGAVPRLRRAASAALGAARRR